MKPIKLKDILLEEKHKQDHRETAWLIKQAKLTNARLRKIMIDIGYTDV